MSGHIQININCSPQEKKAWKKAAYKAEASLASWVRGCLNRQIEVNGTKPTAVHGKSPSQSTEDFELPV